MANLTIMKAKINKELSWEKSTVWDLENGFRAYCSYSQFYGPSISRLERISDGAFWHASNGIDKIPVSYAGYTYLALPDFARPWIEEIRNSHGVIATMVRERFEKEF